MQEKKYRIDACRNCREPFRAHHAAVSYCDKPGCQQANTTNKILRWSEQHRINVSSPYIKDRQGKNKCQKCGRSTKNRFMCNDCREAVLRNNASINGALPN